MKKKQNVIDLVPRGAKYAITTDWFSAILSTFNPMNNDFTEAPEKLEYDSGNIILNKLKFSANGFKYGYEIIFRKKPFALVHVCPTSDLIFANNQMKFELKNNVHYEIGWCSELEYFLNAMGWKVDNTSRVDIALDIDKRHFLKIMNMVLEQKIQYTGKAQIQWFTNGKLDLQGCDIGKRSSDKWVTIYNKSKELEHSNKFYIRDTWVRAGMNIERVDRMELKLRNNAIKEIVGFDWRKLDDFEYLASIFRTFIEGGEKINPDTGEVKYSKGILHLVKKDKQKNISRKKKIEFIDWDYIGGEKLERLSTKQANEVWSMKLTAKRMCWIYFQTKEDHFLHIAREIAFNVNCLQWLSDRFDGWKDHFETLKQDGKLEYISKYEKGYANQQLILKEIDVNVL